ncbi:ATP-binding region ATPase domain protein [Gemmatirosa kalamazoonensis]|uniref:histidine kinase n=2 Tax=Gemmatirosa kalamazoonensis TaxID=861299 RepID=W0RKN8_9BACT|nr:ATP-binding region ATPase domain protein [Gemmatirosa kalamazoonensis]
MPAAAPAADRLRDRTILLVDDEEANLDLLDALLTAEGYTALVRTSDAREVTALVARHAPDLILLDLHMPHRHGLEVLGELRETTTPGDYRPVLVLTADATWEAKERALALGARDFVTKPFDATEVLLRVGNLLETRVLHDDQRAARERAEAAEARAALLAEWSRLLASSLDPSTSFAHLPRLVVPRWATGCVVRLGDAVIAEARTGDPTRLPEAMHVVAIASEGETVGDIVVEHAHGETIDGALFAELAARAGQAAEHARLFAAAERATQERERLLAVVAHDLRNPLGVVGMYAEMLASMQPEDADEYTSAALATIRDGATTMQRLVEDLLDVSALREGALRIHRTEQRVGAPMEEAERMLRPLAAARAIALGFLAEGDSAQRSAPIDGARLVQVLSNLVGNALKFTPERGVVEVRYTASDETLEVWVSDTGPGIAAEDLPHLFTAFWQREPKDRRGVGLGLWIARAIVEAHGGRLQVQSHHGHGTTFHFSLPFSAPTRRWED